MSAFLVLAALAAGVLVWVLSSPVRIASVAVMVFLTHPALMVWLTAVLGLVMLAVAVAVVHRNVADGGWRLVTVTGPSPEPQMEAGSHG